MQLINFFDKGINFDGMDINGTYTFTLTLTNSCGTYTTPVTSYTFTGTAPQYPSYLLSNRPEQMMVYGASQTGGEVKCSNVVNTTDNDTFFYTINPLDPATVTSNVTAVGIAPPGGFPTIQNFGAGTYERFAVVTPPEGGWQVGTYKFSVRIANGDCSVTPSYYIHVSDNNREDVFFPDVSVCYPGNGSISAGFPLPDAYKQIVNSSYFQDFNAIYNFSIVSKPVGSANPSFAPSSSRTFTNDSTFIYNLNKPGDYVVRGVLTIASGGQDTFINQEFRCSNAQLVDTFIIHVENLVNANAGSDQSGICDQKMQLIGNQPGLNGGMWNIIEAPTGALPTLDNPIDANTWIRAMDSVGEYKLTWSISSPFEGCVSTDTVVLMVTCPLPLELIAFQGYDLPNKGNLISWITKSEINILNISLETSHNAKNWQSIYTTTKADSSDALLNYYQFLHSEFSNGNNFYRLKILNQDGTYQFSKVINLNNSGTQQLAYVYPNPAQNFVTVDHIKTGYTLKCYNALGQLQHQEIANQGQTNIDIANWASGIYLLKIYDNTGVHIQTIKWSKN